MQINMIKEAETENYKCPLATRDIKTNLKNRNWAFANVGYGPANPYDETNNQTFWLRKTVIWNTDLDEAKGMRCMNCAAFVQTKQMLECIKEGIALTSTAEKSGYEDEFIEAAQLGFCQLLHFKCAGARTCDAWAVGGPIIDETEENTYERK
jgi:hypothetical protein